MIKPGYKTSEFWFTLVSFIFSGLYLLGLLDSNTQKEDLIQETSKGVEATILIIGQLTVLFKYIKGRTDLKKTGLVCGVWRGCRQHDRNGCADILCGAIGLQLGPLGVQQRQARKRGDGCKHSRTNGYYFRVLTSRMGICSLY